MKIKTMVIGPDLFLQENKNGVNKVTYNVFKNNELLRGDFYYPFYGMSPRVIKEEGFENFKAFPVTICSPRKRGRLSQVYSLFSLRPFLSEPKRLIEYFYKNIKSEMHTHDLIIIFGLSLADLVNLMPPECIQKTVLIPIDCLAYFYKSKIKNEKNILKRLLFRWDQYKARNLEEQVYKKVKKVVFVSDRDAKFAATEFRLSNISYVPQGIDEQYLKKDKQNTKLLFKEKQSVLRLIFTGNFNYGPNIEGAHFLARELMPELERRGVEAQLILAGGNPVASVEALAAANVKVTGFVDSLVPYILEADLFLSPIFFGAGVKNKVLEAMYLEKKVVGTELSFHGIKGEAGKDYILVDKPRDASAWVQKILEAKEGFESMGANGKKVVEENHTWEKARREYNELFMSVIK